MRSDEYYTLSAVNNHLPKILNELDKEIGNLDPSGTFELKMIVAQLRGVEIFVKGNLK
jgi:hypothetical protein